MITIIALQGKTSSGKDSAARYIREIYGIEPVISFATRPIRDSEVEGREHYFINDEQMMFLINELKDGNYKTYLKKVYEEYHELY